MIPRNDKHRHRKLMRMQFNINSTISKMVDFAPVVLFSMLSVNLFLTGYLQSNFYTSVFSEVLPTEYLAVLFPIVIQILRLVTGFLSASFFKKKRYFIGITVFLFSIWLTMFEHNEAKHMGEFWVSSVIDMSTVTQAETVITLTREIITSMMHILIWSALFLELFLALWLSNLKPEQEEKPLTDEMVFSSNGQSKAKAHQS